MAYLQGYEFQGIFENSVLVFNYRFRENENALIN